MVKTIEAEGRVGMISILAWMINLYLECDVLLFYKT